MYFSKTSIEFSKLMKCSKLFQPINIIPPQKECDLKTSLIPKSQKLLIDLGIVRQASNGIFHLLPLGVRSMNKLKSLVRRYLTQVDAQEIKMPTIIDGSLWKRSGRWETTTEIFKFKDKHEKDYIISPTNEESATDLVGGLGSLTYKQLPFLLYQITSKFRDEIKPRCGLIRSKEFDMMDAYSFDVNIESAHDTYEKISTVFERIFNHLELPFIKVLANPGDMGGNVSHEFHLICDIGEDSLNICQTCNKGINKDYCNDICPSCGNATFKQATGIEVGHTFLLGSRYSLPLDCKYKNKDGNLEPLLMGSYGLGLSRILAASVEVLSTEDEITWPSILAPYTVCIITPKEGSKEWEIGSGLCLELCKELNTLLPDDIILDDRSSQTIGKRLRHARRTGYPYIICLGKRILENPPVLELVSVHNNTTNFFTFSELLNRFEDFHQERFKVKHVF